MWLCFLQVVSLSEDKMSVDWNSDDMLKWKDLAKEKQQEYYDSLNKDNWIDYKLSDASKLNKFIGFALFGVSEEENFENFKNKQLKQIGTIKHSIKKIENENILASILYVLVKVGDRFIKFPVIKLLKFDINTQQINNIYIDISGRVYRNWKDYLKNNTLPKCIICYPRNGVYTVENGVIEVEYGTSPAGKSGRKFLRRLDIGGRILGAGAAVVGIAALCVPVALPVVAG